MNTWKLVLADAQLDDVLHAYTNMPQVLVMFFRNRTAIMNDLLNTKTIVESCCGEGSEVKPIGIISPGMTMAFSELMEVHRGAATSSNIVTLNGVVLSLHTYVNLLMDDGLLALRKWLGNRKPSSYFVPFYQLIGAPGVSHIDERMLPNTMMSLGVLPFENIENAHNNMYHIVLKAVDVAPPAVIANRCTVLLFNVVPQQPLMFYQGVDSPRSIEGNFISYGVPLFLPAQLRKFTGMNPWAAFSTTKYFPPTSTYWVPRCVQPLPNVVNKDVMKSPFIYGAFNESLMNSHLGA